MADIFISYAREDLATAEKLAQALIACGWSVWWDRHIPAGRRFDEVIAEQLSNASCILALWSRNGTRSQWVMEEAETARANGVLVPVMIEAAQLPMGFRRIHAADLIGWGGAINHAGFKQLLIDITNMIGRPQRHHATAGLQPFPESAGAETEGVAAANDAAVGLDAAASASSAVETAWDAAAIAAIEKDLTHFIGPVAKVVISRAMQDATDLGSLSTAVARSIPLDADRRQFLIRVNDHWHPKPPSKVNGGGNATTPSSGSARGNPDLSTADANLGLIEQTLARHIGPIARVVLKRAMTQSPTRDDLCEYLATHIEREDDRRQFLATVTRWV